ncbi:MAG: hypothetical protein ABEJ30_03630 [Halorientalis sp.]
MATRLYRGAVFALYQLTLLLAIALLPVALVVRQFGLRVPMDRAVDRLGSAYESAAESP